MSIKVTVLGRPYVGIGVTPLARACPSLIHIKPKPPAVQDTATQCRFSSSDAGMPLAVDQPKGPLADRFAERLRAGARTLEEALRHWLIPRHAAHFEDAVKAGKILLWIRVANADEERNAYQILLATSSNSVGVHDLVLPVDQ
jgi:hypothetical protein